MEKNIGSSTPDPPAWWNSLTQEEKEKCTCAPPWWKYRNLTIEELERDIEEIAKKDDKLTEWPSIN